MSTQIHRISWFVHTGSVQPPYNHIRSVAHRVWVPVLIGMLVFYVGVALAQDVWDPGVQRWVFERVASMLAYTTETSKGPPPVILAESLTNEQFAEAIGYDFYGDARGNFYSWRWNAVLLTQERCSIDVLAHEYVHYFQVHYLLKGANPDANWTDQFELEACRIQHQFQEVHYAK